MEIRVAIKDIEKILQNEEIVKDGMIIDEDELSDYCAHKNLDFYAVEYVLETYGYDFI